jgi:glycosyltransferase involved in cell wall biosynthesis
MNHAIRVYVHLATAQDAEDWEQRFDSGSLVGLNDSSPYGYARANAMGCKVEFSLPGNPGVAGRSARLILRALLGFDYLHARNNRKRMLASDIIWTHTESQFLGVAAVLAGLPRGAHRPKLIGQAVWMFDQWPARFALQKWLHRRLVEKVDILSVLSPQNEKVARELFPHKRVEFVRFGIPNESFEPVIDRPAQPIHVVSLGNDRHRDWNTAIEALGSQNGIILSILSTAVKPSLAARHSNVLIKAAKTNAELKQVLREATLMLVPLKPNIHASGITAIQEAALFGLPVIATGTGGLRSYFDETCVTYVQPGDPVQLLAEVRRLAKDPVGRLKQAQRAQDRFKEPDMGCEAYVRCHVNWSQELMRESKAGTNQTENIEQQNQ